MCTCRCSCAVEAVSAIKVDFHALKQSCNHVATVVICDPVGGVRCFTPGWELLRNIKNEARKPPTAKPERELRDAHRDRGPQVLAHLQSFQQLPAL